MSIDERQARELLAELSVAKSPSEFMHSITRHLDEIGGNFFAVLGRELQRVRKTKATSAVTELLKIPLAVNDARCRTSDEILRRSARRSLELAHTHLQDRNFDGADFEAEQAQETFETIDDRLGVAETWVILAATSEGCGRIHESIEHYVSAADLARHNGFWEIESFALGRAAELSRQLGDSGKARALLLRRLACPASVGDRALAHLSLGHLDLVAGAWMRATRRSRLALRAGDGVLSASQVAEANANLGAALLHQNKPGEARRHLIEARSGLGDSPGGLAAVNAMILAIEKPDVPSVAARLHELYVAVEAAWPRGDADELLPLLEEQLSTARATGQRDVEAFAQANIGKLRRDILRDPEAAMECLNEALAIARSLGAAAPQSALLRSIGHTQRMLGRRAEALASFKELLRAAEAGKNAHDALVAALDAGIEEKNSERFSSALGFFEQALKIAETLGDDESRVIALGNIGNVAEQWGNLAAAETMYTDGLELASKIGFAQGISNHSNNLGSIFHRQGKYAEAIQAIQRAIDTATGMKSNEFVAAGLRNLALVLDEDNQSAAALQALDRAAGLIADHTGAQIAGEIYALRARLQNRMNDAANEDWAQACQIAERESDADFAGVRDVKVFTKLARLYRSRILDEAGRGEAIAALELMEALRSKPLRALTGAASLNYSQMHDLLMSQGKQITVLSFSMFADQLVGILQFSNDAKPQMEVIPITMEDILDVFQRYFQEVENYPEHPDLDETWTELGSALLSPFSEGLASSELVYFCLDGVLWSLPLHALLVGKQPLFEIAPVAYIDSLLRLSVVSSLRKNRTLAKEVLCAGVGLIINDDALFQGEARIAARAFDGRADVGHSVTRKRLLDEMPGKDVIHISCHGEWRLDGTNLILRDESERLTVEDIVRTRLSADLVFLSGCNTTWLDPETLIAGLKGLPVAFLQAGATKVISARWPVSAAVSLQIVHEFYNSLNTPGISVAKALQTAQLNMLKKPHYQRHTYYWAPFSLLGDWY